MKEEAEKLWAKIEQEGKEVVTSLVSETSDENNFFVRYQKWLATYELLGQEAQQNLRGHKKLIEKDQNSLHKGTERRGKRQQWWMIKFEEIEELIKILENQLKFLENQKVGNMKIFLISLFTSLLTVIIAYSVWVNFLQTLFQQFLKQRN